MVIGARGHDFGRHSPGEFPKIVKEKGFDAVQLALTKAITGIEKFSDITDKHLEQVQEHFAKHNLEIAVLGCYIEPSLLDNEKRAEQVMHFKNGLTHAKKLGVGVVGTETTNLDINSKEREKVYQVLKDSVLRMVEHAEKENVCIGIEPVAEHTLNSVELTQRLLDEVNSKKLKIIFDPVNMILPTTVQNQEEIYKEFLTVLGDKIVALHMKDVVMENNEKVWRNIGQGVVNYQPIFEYLHKHKPDMRLLREHVKMDSYEVDLAAMKMLGGLQ